MGLSQPADVPQLQFKLEWTGSQQLVGGSGSEVELARGSLSIPYVPDNYSVAATLLKLPGYIFSAKHVSDLDANGRLRVQYSLDSGGNWTNWLAMSLAPSAGRFTYDASADSVITASAEPDNPILIRLILMDDVGTTSGSLTLTVARFHAVYNTV
jgi:hypothetical protein